MRTVNLDCNSTTPLHPLVAAALQEAYQESYLNPASQHRPGQIARQALERFRAEIIALLGGQIVGMRADRLILTSGGTEANNLILQGLASEGVGKQVLVSAIEHPSILAAAEHLRRRGQDVKLIPVDRAGQVRLDALEHLLAQPTSLVSVMLANNETGVIQPLDKIVELSRVHGALVHTDAVQAVGKIPVDFSKLQVDALTFTPHKFYGPRGIGGLLLKSGVAPEPILFGGFQQAGIRPGTEDVALASGCHRALQLCLEDQPAKQTRLHQLRSLFFKRLHSGLSGPVELNGNFEQSLPNTLNLAFPGVDRQALLLAADFAGLAISTGSACASGSSEPSPVLLAMGLPAEIIESSVRISFGTKTEPGDLEWAADQLCRIVNGLRK
jgi:cysteine desulfurase